MTAPRARVEVTVVLPRVLADVLGGARIRVSAATVAEALEEAYSLVPALRSHLCEESGRFREHVLCFHNDTCTRDLGTLELPLHEGDEITILQALSGG